MVETVLEPKHRRQIESTLGRTLIDEELAVAPSLDQLTEPVLAVARALARSQGVICVLYLRAAASAHLRDAMIFMDELRIGR